MRAVGDREKSSDGQWYKEKRWQIGEHNLGSLLSTRKYKKVQERKKERKFRNLPYGTYFIKYLNGPF